MRKLLALFLAALIAFEPATAAASWRAPAIPDVHLGTLASALESARQGFFAALDVAASARANATQDRVREKSSSAESPESGPVFFLFTGEQLDPVTDLYNLRARWMSPGVGRFATQDAWQGKQERPITLNKYAYAGQDPINHSDPSGNSFDLGSTLTALNAGAQLATAATIGYSVGTFFVSDAPFQDRAKTLGMDILLSAMPVGAVAGYMARAGLKFVSVGGKTFYRYMSKAELEAIVNSGGRLRGDRPGSAYFTTDLYGSRHAAKSRLALPDEPEIRVKFVVSGNPTTIYRPVVKATPTEPGGGVEYFSSEGVFVDILDVLELAK